MTPMMPSCNNWMISEKRALGSQHLRSSKKVLSGRPGQVDSLSGQVTFHSHLPNGQGIGKPSAN